jgi:hypothetical protein
VDRYHPGHAAVSEDRQRTGGRRETALSRFRDRLAAPLCDGQLAHDWGGPTSRSR